MKNIKTTIKFDGPALKDRAMDVGHLAPSLLALSELVKATNFQINGERAKIKILVNADLEQKCFELNLEIVQTIWEQAKTLLADEDIKSAKELLGWIGISSIPAFGYSLYRLIEKLRGKEIESVTVIKILEEGNLLEIKVRGEVDPLQVTETVYKLYYDRNIRQKALDFLGPLREEGYDSLKVYQDEEVFTEFLKDDIPVADGSDLPEIVVQNQKISMITADVRIRKAAYEGKSRWTLVYKHAMEVPIDDEKWLEKFQNGIENAPPGSSLQVDLEETYITNEDDEIISDPLYRVKKVHKVLFPSTQLKMNFKDMSRKSKDEDSVEQEK